MWFLTIVLSQILQVHLSCLYTVFVQYYFFPVQLKAFLFGLVPINYGMHFNVELASGKVHLTEPGTSYRPQRLQMPVVFVCLLIRYLMQINLFFENTAIAEAQDELGLSEFLTLSPEVMFFLFCLKLTELTACI